MTNEVKRRRNKQNDEPSDTSAVNHAANYAQRRAADGGAGQAASCRDMKTFVCLVCVAACGLLTWVVLQQNEKFSELEEKLRAFHEKTAVLFSMKEEVLGVSEQCQGVQEALAALEQLQQELGQVEGVAGDRGPLQARLEDLEEAVGQVERQTAATAQEVAAKVASVRTDVRRMEGLGSELQALLEQQGELEARVVQAERGAVRRIGEALAGSVERVAALRYVSDQQADALLRLGRQADELSAAGRLADERLRALEGGRARLVRALSFSADLKPKVGSLERGLAALEPHLADLTLRIGTLAQDLGRGEGGSLDEVLGAAEPELKVH